MKIKRCCKNCGAVLELTKENHYLVEEKGEGILPKTIVFDAYDCKVCGRQYIAGVRALNYKKEES